jgi:Skp family chaperone for outer membrane proteins
MSKPLTLVLFLLLLSSTSLCSQDAYIALLGSDIQAEKLELITETMDFTAEEAEEFWPVYAKYAVELNKINKETVQLINEYSKSIDNMSNDQAEALMAKWFELRERRLQLKKDYFQKYKEALSVTRAVKLIQLENQINMLTDLKIASQLPLIE